MSVSDVNNWRGLNSEGWMRFLALVALSWAMPVVGVIMMIGVAQLSSHGLGDVEEDSVPRRLPATARKAGNAAQRRGGETIATLAASASEELSFQELVRSTCCDNSGSCCCDDGGHSCDRVPSLQETRGLRRRDLKQGGRADNRHQLPHDGKSSSEHQPATTDVQAPKASTTENEHQPPHAVTSPKHQPAATDVQDPKASTTENEHQPPHGVTRSPKQHHTQTTDAETPEVASRAASRTSEKNELSAARASKARSLSPKGLEVSAATPVELDAEQLPHGLTSLKYPLAMADVASAAVDWSTYQRPLIGFENLGTTCYMNASLQAFLSLPPLVEFMRNIEKNQNEVAKADARLQICLGTADKRASRMDTPVTEGDSQAQLVEEFRHLVVDEIFTKDNIMHLQESGDGALAPLSRTGMRENVFCPMALASSPQPAWVGSGDDCKKNYLDRCQQDPDEFFRWFFPSIAEVPLLTVGHQHRSIIRNLFDVSTLNTKKPLAAEDPQSEYLLIKEKVESEVALILRRIDQAADELGDDPIPLRRLLSLNYGDAGDEHIDDVEFEDAAGGTARLATLSHNSLAALPPILVMQLSRFEFDFSTMETRKLNHQVDFPLTGLDMREFLSLPENAADAQKAASTTYDLAAVICHSGVEHSAQSGHYYTAARVSDTRWAMFNDEHADPVDTLDIDIMRTAYMLFYTRRVPDTASPNTVEMAH
ncbi:unnamed protein product [Amoebophrya sp. A25]|nr:unnamed protein product [Amoebophrya sp. A25]|eukprot:GSA25T00009837001.1